MSELITRLNPKTCRFDVGSGGTRELTDQDVAAALGMVQNKLGADVMCFLHWPAGLDVAAFETVLLQKIRVECWNRQEEVVNAELRYHMHRKTRAFPRSETVEAMKKTLWPSFDLRNWPRYVRLVVSVLDEIRSGPICKRCNGRAKLVTEAGVNECGHCGGTGKTDESHSRRAARMGLQRPPYQRQWDEPYRWLLGELLSAQVEANDQFRRALGRRNAA